MVFASLLMNLEIICDCDLSGKLWLSTLKQRVNVIDIWPVHRCVGMYSIQVFCGMSWMQAS